jgi:hypothetical protein
MKIIPVHTLQNFKNEHGWKSVLVQLEKIGREWKVYQYSSENGHGCDMESSTTLTKMGAVVKVYLYSKKNRHGRKSVPVHCEK